MRAIRIQDSVFLLADIQSAYITEDGTLWINFKNDEDSEYFTYENYEQASNALDYILRGLNS